MNTGGQSAVINVTPMIDVLLVLLIIFMAIAPQKSVGLDALLPNSHDVSTPERQDPVVLEVRADSVYRLNTALVARADLAEKLHEIYARRAERLLFVKAAPELEFRDVAEAIDIAHGAAVDHVALMR